VIDIFKFLSMAKLTINTFDSVYQTSVYENNVPANYVQLSLLYTLRTTKQLSKI
ncbi:MAG: hypothetical protein JWR67_1113, partial [Mucilaginibacter sp.]|nr:hypothetical protein [Mucilaginibacter sp.]